MAALGSPANVLEGAPSPQRGNNTLLLGGCGQCFLLQLLGDLQRKTLAAELVWLSKK